MKILIIDDDQLTSTTWSMGLKSAGFDVVNATNGQDGINQSKSQKPDLILLDQIMPDMLGNAVLTTLKQDPETSPIPVMLISNYNENQMMKDAIAQGAVDYILKYQIETKDLVDKVQSLLTQLKVPGATPAPSTPAAQAAIDSSSPAASPAPVAPPVPTTSGDSALTSTPAATDPAAVTTTAAPLSTPNPAAPPSDTATTPSAPVAPPASTDTPGDKDTTGSA